MPIDRQFGTFCRRVSDLVGRPASFVLSVLIVVAWGASGPLFRFSDTWQLVINTGTTIVTFLLVVLLQHTQNRDTAALQIKLDELIRANEGAHNALLDLEELGEQELASIRSAFAKLAQAARAKGEPAAPPS